ncbi:MAG: oligosaccharide flippase family protein [Desulfatirhabdiaceae bacterium]
MYSISNVILRFTTFLLIPIYVNYLSSEEYGLLSAILITSEFLAIIMRIGMREAQIRFFQEYQEKNQIGTLLATSTFVSVLGGSFFSAICLFFLPSFFQKIFHVDDVNQYIILACLAAFFQMLFEHLTTFYRARNEALSFTITNIVAAILIVSANGIMFLWFHYNVSSPLIAHVLAHGIVFLVVSVNLFMRYGIRISKELTIRLFRFGLPLIFSLSGQRIFYPTATYILSIYSGLTDVALFTLGTKFASIVSMVLILPFQMAFQPFLFVNLQNADIKVAVSKFLTFFIYAIVLLSMTVIVGTKILLPFIAPPDYFEAISVFILSLPATGFLSLVIFGEALANITYKTRATGMIIGFSGLFGVFLNYLLIPFLGWYGAIISLNISAMVTGTAMLYYGIICYPIRLEWKQITFSICAFSLFIVFSFLFRSENILMFCFIMLTSFSFVAFGLHFFSLFDEREKDYFRNLVFNIHKRLNREKII